MQWHCLAVFFIHYVFQKFGRTVTARNHRLRVSCTADITGLDIIRLFCIFFRIFSAFQTFVGFRNMAADVKFRRCIDQFVIHFLFTDLFHSQKRISPFAVTIADAVIASIYVPPMLKIQLTLYTDLEYLSWSMVLVRLYYTRVELVTGDADYLTLTPKQLYFDIKSVTSLF